MLKIENSIDDNNINIDCETIAGVQTLTCANDSQIILSRQSHLQQLWIAAKSGGFHFEISPSNQWVCNRSGKLLNAVLSHCIKEQSEELINLDHL